MQWIKNKEYYGVELPLQANMRAVFQVQKG